MTTTTKPRNPRALETALVGCALLSGVFINVLVGLLFFAAYIVAKSVRVFRTGEKSDRRAEAIWLVLLAALFFPITMVAADISGDAASLDQTSATMWMIGALVVWFLAAKLGTFLIRQIID